MARKAKEARENIGSQKAQNTKLSTTFAEGGNKNEIHQRVSQTEYNEMSRVSEKPGPDRYSEGNRKAQENARSLKESVLGKIGTAQDDAARQWAKEHGVWFDLSSSNFGIPFPSGDGFHSAATGRSTRFRRFEYQRKRASILFSSATSIGFEMCSFIPAFKAS